MSAFDEDQEKAAAPESPPTYDVGYGKPPAHTRFRKGRSGNPKGRPKGSKSAQSLLEQALSAPVAINEGGTTRVVEQRMALFKSLVARAIKGDTRAAALVVKLMEQFERNAPPEKREPITVIELRALQPEDAGTSPDWQDEGGKE